MHTVDETRENKLLYKAVYRTLVAGMYASTALFIVGVALAALHPERIPPTLGSMQGYYHWSVIQHGITAADPVVLMMIAVILMILTPISRVFISIVSFLYEGDILWACITAFVLATIAISFALAHAGLLR